MDEIRKMSKAKNISLIIKCRHLQHIFFNTVLLLTYCDEYRGEDGGELGEGGDG